MSFLFLESYYLDSYPDVKAAVKAGSFISGLDHFTQFGLNEGRFLVSPFYDENFYLNSYPDVKAAVDAGTFKSGLQHLVQYGQNEGRTLVSPFYDENAYLQKYADVRGAVRSGNLKSGFQHYVNYGEFQGFSGTDFNEEVYRAQYPDVANQIATGVFASGLEHYYLNGQNDQNRSALFSGTKGNDQIGSFGQSPSLVGVDFDVINSAGGQFDVIATSIGTGEMDTLIGGAGNDKFILGLGRSTARPNPQSFYIGQGANDFALIANFIQGTDTIQLAGLPANYNFIKGEDRFRILSSTGDLIAVVLGVPSLNVVSQLPNLTFLLG